MQDRRGVNELDVVLVGKLDGLVELLGVEGDGLLAQHVLARGERPAHEADVGVVRRGDVDGVHVWVGIELLGGLVDALDAPALGKRHGLGVRAVLHGHELAAGERKRLRHLVGDAAAADDGPAQLRGLEEVAGEGLALDGREGRLCRRGGVDGTGVGVVCHVRSSRPAKALAFLAC